MQDCHFWASLGYIGSNFKKAEEKDGVIEEVLRRESSEYKGPGLGKMIELA